MKISILFQRFVICFFLLRSTIRYFTANGFIITSSPSTTAAVIRIKQNLHQVTGLVQHKSSFISIMMTTSNQHHQEGGGGNSCNSKNKNDTTIIAKNSKKRNLYTFRDAKRIARNYGFDNKEEYIEYDCPGSYQLPKNPQEVWSNDGWISWEDFLGIPYTYNEAKDHIKETKIYTKYNIETKNDYLKLLETKSKYNNNDCSEGEDYEKEDLLCRLPYRPDLKYKNNGWISWDDWLKAE